LYSTRDVAVSLRLLRALIDIVCATPDPIFHRILLECGRRMIAGCSAAFDDEDLKPLRSRLTEPDGFTGSVEGGAIA